MPSHQVLLSTRFVYVAAAVSNEVWPALRRRVSVDHTGVHQRHWPKRRGHGL